MQPISPDLIDRAKRVLDAPSWEELSQIFRSDERRNYKINVSTDALEEEDDVDQKEQTLEFGKTVIEMMGQIIPGVQANPTLAPFAKELIMTVVKRFKVARPLEEALEDGLNQMASQPQQPQPNPEMIRAQAEIQKAQTEAKIAETKAQSELLKIQSEAQTSGNEGQLKLREIELKHQRELLSLQLQQENLELNKYKILLSLKQLGIATRAQALQEFEASGHAQDLHERRMADFQGQQTDQSLQAHDQVNRHAIEHRKIDAQQQIATQKAAEGGDGAGGPRRKTSANDETKGNAPGMDALAQIAQALVEQAKSHQQLADHISAPKHVIRDESGRVVGIASKEA